MKWNHLVCTQWICSDGGECKVIVHTDHLTIKNYCTHENIPNMWMLGFVWSCAYNHKEDMIHIWNKIKETIVCLRAWLCIQGWVTLECWLVWIWTSAKIREIFRLESKVDSIQKNVFKGCHSMLEQQTTSLQDFRRIKHHIVWAGLDLVWSP
jgi:hypothetical protein